MKYNMNEIVASLDVIWNEHCLAQLQYVMINSVERKTCRNIIFKTSESLSLRML